MQSEQKSPTRLDAAAAEILARAVAGEDIGRLLAYASERLLEQGVPLFRTSLGMPAIDPTVRGLNWVWWRPGAVNAAPGQAALQQVLHDDGIDGGYAKSPVRFMRDRNLLRHRWRLEEPEMTALLAEEVPLLSRLRQAGCTDFVMRLVPFGEGGALVGAAFSAATDRPGGFAEEELPIGEQIMPALALAAYRHGIARAASTTLDAYLGALTGPRVLAGTIRRGDGQVIRAAILLADLRGFSALANSAAPSEIVTWLNEYFDAMGEPILARGGEILKFLGDGLLAVFPAEADPEAEAEACARALAAAEAALLRVDTLNAVRSNAPTLLLDIALHFGEVFYGNIGTARRLDFTVIGRAVNEASRIEHLCDALERHLLLSADFAERCRSIGCPVSSLGRHPLAGVGEREIFAAAR